MKIFWNEIIGPVIESMAPKHIIEIGADSGINTRNLLHYCKNNGCILTSIDPQPSYDVDAYRTEFSGSFQPVFKMSLQAIKECSAADIVLIDGDHNWYTVFHELIEIEKAMHKPFPLVLFHDTGWPYGRRDMYYDPANIPQGYMHKYHKGGLEFGNNKLVEGGGFNPHLHHAIECNTNKNGVLTAIEDFCDQSSLTLKLDTFEGLNGLTFLYAVKNKRAASVLSSTPISERLNRLIEEERIKASMSRLAERQGLLARIDLQRRESEKLHVKLSEYTNRLKKSETLLNKHEGLVRELKKENVRARELAQSLRISNRIKRVFGLHLATSQRSGNPAGFIPMALRAINMILPFVRPMSRIPIAGKFLKWVYHRVNWSQQIEGVPDLKKTLEILGQTAPELDYSDKIVDIIVPVYNAFDFLQPLFDSLFNNSDVPFNVIIIDDASPDKRVWPLLKEIENAYDNVLLLCNSENQGFVKTVNRGLKRSKIDVVIINTDVEVPKGWLSRLMFPIFEMDKVASATPMSNSSSITSFPNLMQHNELFEGKSLAFIDESFRKIRSCEDIFVDTPTGHGFCMAMSRQAMRKISFFDEKAFGKGCGEENDWSMRARQKGFKNLIVPNLYCFHNHVSSFTKDQKDQLTYKNMKIIRARYPNYSKLVKDTAENEFYQSLRLIVVALLYNQIASRTIVCFTNTLSGGSTYANKDFISQQNRSESLIINIRTASRRETYQLEFHFRDSVDSLKFDSLHGIKTILELFRIDEVLIHQLFGYLKLEQLLPMLIAVREKKGFKMTMDIRDFFVLCPTVQLLNHEKHFCNASLDMDVCSGCMRKLGTLDPSFSNVTQWRAMWGKFLSALDQINVYSDFTRQLLLKVYKEEIKTHKLIVGEIPIEYIRRIKRRKKDRGEVINIGVIGNIGVHKGVILLNEMADIVGAGLRPAQIEFFIFGKLDVRYDHQLFNKVGEYKREQLADLIEEHNIDIIFIASIWGETFCRTAQESILMELPTACFNLGAPAERVKRYEKGLLIDQIDADYALSQIIEFVEMTRNNGL